MNIRICRHMFAFALVMCLTVLSSRANATLLTNAVQNQAAIKLVTLRTEYRENPLGIDARRPRLSWQL